MLLKRKQKNKTPTYETVSFVKKDSENWVQRIYEILRLIFEVFMKSEIEAELSAIFNWSAGIHQQEQEANLNSFNTIDDEIYGKILTLCRIPTQSMKKIKELEKKVQALANYAIDNQNVCIFSIN